MTVKEALEQLNGVINNRHIEALKTLVFDLRSKKSEKKDKKKKK